MYAYGTSCECNNCKKKWVITYKDALEFEQAIKSVRGQAELGAFTLGCALISGNKMNLLNANVMTNGVINNANHVIDRYKNGDMLQYKYCPECRSPFIIAERFYYEIDNQADFVRQITEQEYNNEINRINNEKIQHNNRLKKLAEKDKIEDYHFITIVMLILCYPIGFVLLWNDKKIDKHKRQLACKIFWGLIGIILFISVIIMSLLSIIGAV